MIFVTVGSQMPFDRLIKAVDAWARDHREQAVEAQIGNSEFVPQFMACTKTLTPSEFAARMASASIIVAHAGMGTIISAAEFGKPMILLPRRGALRETRNDHQIATAKWLAAKPGISVAYDDSELADILTREISRVTEVGLSSAAPAEMIQALKGIVGRL
jgi:UDP-N-acetylglucosamine transferase subunit ALG13